MRFERAILVVGAAAALLFVLLGIEAFGRPLNLPILIRHALLGGLACLLHLFSQGWMLLFVFGLGRAVERSHPGVAEGLKGALTVRRRLLGWAVVLLLPTLATFLAGGAAFMNRLPVWVHPALFLLAAPAQLLALWRERALLAAHQRLLAGAGEASR